MTPVERHAELGYQEHLLMKAVLGILYSGDWLQFIKEALNLRSANIAYRNMHEYLVQADKEARGVDKSIDAHFRSGVMFGTAINSLILSMLPTRVVTVRFAPRLRESQITHLILLLQIVSLFGYEGDREESLAMLYEIGGWSHTTEEPDITEAEEGVRRPIADISLLIFHLLLSNYTYKGVDLSMVCIVFP